MAEKLSLQSESIQMKLTTELRLLHDASERLAVKVRIPRDVQMSTDAHSQYVGESAEIDKPVNDEQMSVSSHGDWPEQEFKVNNLVSDGQIAHNSHTGASSKFIRQEASMISDQPTNFFRKILIYVLWMILLITVGIIIIFDTKISQYLIFISNELIDSLNAR